MWKMKPIYMQEADVSGSPGAAPATPGTSPQTGAPAAASTGGSVLSQGGQALSAGQAPAATGGDPQPGPLDWVPEKHRVLKDGTQELDLDATAKKLADANRAFEKRFGAGDVPPKTPEEYKFEKLPEGITFEDIKADPKMQSFIKGAHALGFTNAQLEFAMNEHLGIMSETIAASESLSVEECTAELRKSWPSQKDFQLNTGNAYRAFKAFADPADQDAMEELGNHPALVRMLANIGRELQEDEPIESGSAAAQNWDQEVAALRAHAGYADASHPEHKIVIQKIDALYSKRYGTQKSRLGGGKTFSMAS